MAVVLGLTSAPARSGDFPQAGGLDSLEATRNRPLFSPTRRPVEHPQADVPAPVVHETVQRVIPSFELQGIIFGDYRRVAIVKHPQDARTTELSIGSQIDGWVVADIQPRRIALHQASTNFILNMPEAGH